MTKEKKVVRTVRPALATSVAEVARELNANAVEVKKPGVAVLALEMLGEGKTYEDIRKVTGLTFANISSLRARHEVPLEERRKQLATDGFEMAEGLRLLAKQKMENLADNPEELAKTNLRDIVLPYAIAQDKAFAALGENRVIIEHRAKGPTLEDAMKEIEAARAKLRAASVEVVVTPS